MAQGGEAGGPNLQLVADDRSNSILISGDPALRLRIRALIAHLDTPLDTGGETLVRYLQLREAPRIWPPSSRSRSPRAASGGGERLEQSAAPRRPRRAAPPDAVAADQRGERHNGLAGRRHRHDLGRQGHQRADHHRAASARMRALNAVIDKLDIRRAQVHVEAIIVEVSADKTADLGINWIVDGTNSQAGGRRLHRADRRRLGSSTCTTSSKGTSTDLSQRSDHRHHCRRSAGSQATGVNFARHRARAAGRFAHQHHLAAHASRCATTRNRRSRWRRKCRS